MIDELVVAEILKELSSSEYACFASEAQLRDAFAITLTKKYPDCIVYPEYSQPAPVGWRCSEKIIHFDLLVKEISSGELILFEFKYKTKNGNFKLPLNTIYLNTNNDSCNGRYAVWRDIYRIETFVDIKKITKGFIVFITSIRTYEDKPNKGTVAEQFSLSAGLQRAGERNWNIPAGKTLLTFGSISKPYRLDIYPLITVNDYYFQYDLYSSLIAEDGKKHDFKQLIVPIHSKDYNTKINSLLRKVGKGTFIKYYHIFKNDSSAHCKSILLKDGMSKNSVNTIVMTAKDIFNKRYNIEALRNIIASQKVDGKTREQALKLLKTYI